MIHLAVAGDLYGVQQFRHQLLAVRSDADFDAHFDRRGVRVLDMYRNLRFAAPDPVVRHRH